VIAQRAYLYLSGVRLKRYPENTIVITYPIYNAGQTPATWIGEFCRANVYPLRVYPDPFKRGEVAIIKRSVTIAPTRTDVPALTPTYSIDLTTEEIEAISNQQSQLVLHGFFRYRDIFGRWHDTGFGAAYSGALMPNEQYFMAWIQREGFNWFD
jgi:hypothetical protein